MSEIRTIYKYQIHGTGAYFEMPLGARILCVQLQNDVPTMWALVDPNAELVRRYFYLMVTGGTFDAEGLAYVGTYQLAGSSAMCSKRWRDADAERTTERERVSGPKVREANTATCREG
jgi:hypothetical protein